MHRIDADAHVSNQFSDGDTGIGQPGTRVDAAWLNAVQEEIANAIEDAGGTLVKGTNDQLAQAIAGRFPALSWGAITPPANWSVNPTPASTYPDVPAYFKDAGGVVHFKGGFLADATGPYTGVSTWALPAGSRPLRDKLFVVTFIDGVTLGTATLLVRADGKLQVTVYSGTVSLLDIIGLDGVSFVAEQ